nr:hypothetical protein [Nitrosomonas nitrosa]
MQHHPTFSQLVFFCARTLTVSELTAIAQHLAMCPECRRTMCEIFAQRRENKTIAFSLTESEWFRDAHLDYEQIVALAEGTLNKINAAIITSHLETCVCCKTSVDDFLVHRQRLEAEMKMHGLPDENLANAELAAGV